LPISEKFTASYYRYEKWIVRKKRYEFLINNNMVDLIDYESEFQNQVLKFSEGNTPEIKYALEIRKSILNRKNWYLNKNNKKKIWLISDRFSTADDNGEALFIYLNQIKDENIDVYFVIDSDSPDFERLSKIGNVIAQDSKKHHIIHMMADYIISSQADEYVIDPFYRKNKTNELFKDFYANQKFIFLQHGITKDDVSKWLNKYNKNIEGFVVSVFNEAKSILDYKYYYKHENIWLTGMPRIDRLYHNEMNHILVMPSWRKWLLVENNDATSQNNIKIVRKDFENTEYFKFYHDFINNERLLEACDKYSYKLCWMPHPNIRERMNMFVEDERIVVYNFDKKYRDAFAEGNLLITDYSSTAFDFVQLKKPVVYAQFDSEIIFGGSHTYSKGYFDYERDGFGEVVYKIEKLVDLVIDYMKHGCKLKPVYEDRIDMFFLKRDGNNCKRVYQKIKALDSKIF